MGEVETDRDSAHLTVANKREEEVAAEETGTRRTGRAERAPRARGAFRGRFGERGLADCSAPRGAGGAGAPGAQLRTLPAAVRGAANRSN